jgi:SPP1 family predicted phage head-tail adaptor
MRIGSMRHRVSIQRQSQTKNAVGELVEQWDEILIRPAAMDKMPGNETWASAQRNGRIPTIFRMRYESGLVPGMRLVCKGRVYNIKSILTPTDNDSEMVLHTEELVVG